MRLLIVDDEVIIRTGLASVIAWHELGIELLQPSASAEEALTRMAEERPTYPDDGYSDDRQIGAGTAEEGLRLLPELEVIILSGYDDFSYAQQAIRQGVTDYLLKTSKPEEIIKTVLQAKQRITERWAEKSREGSLCGRIESGYLLDGSLMVTPLRAIFLRFLRSDAGKEAGVVGLDDEQILRQVIILRAEGWDQSSDALLRFAVQNTLEDMLPGAIAHVEKQQIICVVSWPPVEHETTFRLESALRRVEQLLKCTLRAAVGLPMRGYADLHESYRTASVAFRYRGLMDDKVWHYEHVQDRQGGKTVLTHEEETRLGTILLDNDSVTLTTWTRELVANLITEPEVTPESFNACLHSAVIAGHRWLLAQCEPQGVKNPQGSSPGCRNRMPKLVSSGICCSIICMV